MTLSSASFTDQHDWFTALHISTLGQLPNPRSRNLRGLREIELLQRLHTRELRVANPVADSVTVPLFAFHRQQGFQISDVAVVLLHRLFRQGNKVGPDGGHADGFT